MTIALILLTVHFHRVGGEQKFYGAFQVVVALAENLQRLSRVRTAPTLTIDGIHTSIQSNLHLVATDPN